MSDRPALDYRVLVLAPTGNDAANAVYVLHKAQIDGIICHDCADLVRKFAHGCGTMLVAEEALDRAGLKSLLDALAHQPQWSDIPLILIGSSNTTEEHGRQLLKTFTPQGNVTLLERPLRAVALTSAVQVALRARRKQYEIRDFLAHQQQHLLHIQENERRFRAVFNQQFQFMAILSPEGIVMEINDLPLLTAGISRDQAVGKLFWETPYWAHLPETRRTWPQRLAHAANTNGPVLSVDEFETADGEVRIADAAVTAVKGADGTVEFFIIQASDVTERKKAEEALRRKSEQYQTLFNSIDEGFCVLEMIMDSQNRPVDYRFIEVNPAFEKQSGLHNALGKPMRQLVPDLEDYWFETYGTVALTGKPIRFENRAESLKRWFDVYAFRIGDPRLRRVAVLFTDITERKNTEQALRRSEERYRELVTQVPDYAIFNVDLNGVITSWNEGARRVFGWSADEAIGTNSKQNFTQEDIDKGVPDTELEEARTKGRAGNDRWMRRNTGDIFWASGVTTPFRSPQGEVIGFTKVLRDLTEQKQMEQELQDSRRQLQRHADELEQRVQERTARLHETISELEAFSYSVSHELRAPLLAMQGYSHFLLEDCGEKLEATGRDYVVRIVKAAERLDRLVSDILTYSRVSRANITSSAIDLEVLMQEVIQGYPALHHDHAEIIIKSPLHKVLGHEGSLTQCISNLLANAVKFVPEGRRPRVEIWTESCDGHVRINFRDNGIGIASKDQQRIFRMFEKAGEMKSYEGTGIGLAIVSKAVERMGGEVGVVSELGQGSLFWLRLPGAL